jgi:hypothetical protein
MKILLVDDDPQLRKHYERVTVNVTEHEFIIPETLDEITEIVNDEATQFDVLGLDGNLGLWKAGLTYKDLLKDDSKVFRPGRTIISPLKPGSLVVCISGEGKVADYMEDMLPLGLRFAYTGKDVGKLIALSTGKLRRTNGVVQH